MIPASVIEDLKFRNRIEDVIGSYVTLSRSGSTMKGLCPFHSEKSPSFTVYTTGDSHFYCFGCGAGGDVISFIMRAENLDYVSALQFLADRSGITLPQDDYSSPRGVSRQRVLEMNKLAARFYREMLFNSEEGQEGRAYFQKRQLSPAIIKRFGLGYAPDSFGALRDHLKSCGFSEAEMLEADLCKVSKKNEKSVYDAFRHRVMFPIIDTAGNVIAFGGRVLDDSKPKYLNSSDTPAFKKSRNLFALNYAKNYCKDGFILCEGYMDVIALHAAGFQNAVATLGTAITSDQARLMKRYTDKVIISYDSDAAGRNAANKALKLLGEAGIEARVLKMSGAKDPDEYIKAFGADKFAELTRESRSGFDYKIEGVKEKYDLSVPENKVRAADELCREIAEMSSGVEREIYASSAAKALGLDLQSIKLDIEAILRKKKFAAKKERKSELIRITAATGDRVNPDMAKNLKCGRLEETVIGLMLCGKEFVKLGAQLLCGDDFYTALNRRLFEFIAEAEKSGGFDIGMLSEQFTEDEVSRAVKLKTDKAVLTANGEAALREASAALKKEVRRLKDAESGSCDLEELIRRRRSEG